LLRQSPLPPTYSLMLTYLQQRRKLLAEISSFPLLLWSGSASPRNFPALRYPFRASSHFLYFAGFPLENAVIYVAEGGLELFWDEPSRDAALWQGESPSRQEIGEKMGAQATHPLSKLPPYLPLAASFPAIDLKTYQEQCHLLGRSLSPLNGKDLDLAHSVITLRLKHDPLALEEIKKAIEVSIKAHLVGMQTVKHSSSEAEVRAAIESVIMTNNMTNAYNSIVTVEGEVLHNEHYHNKLVKGDLLLVDVGAETPLGWAADITRTYPVSGTFSPTQRDLYEVVLAAQKACINKIAPGVEYESIHLTAAQILTEGLINLGILRGSTEEIVNNDAHALFFPHGIGHLLGLDVHDMEDLGDLAGYAKGRKRSHRFGLNYLRLNRPLEAGMVVTIEPGFYQIPSLLKSNKDYVNWETLANFKDVRGIRIEDDVLVTGSGYEVLTAGLPKTIQEIEAIIS